MQSDLQKNSIQTIVIHRNLQYECSIDSIKKSMVHSSVDRFVTASITLLCVARQRAASLAKIWSRYLVDPEKIQIMSYSLRLVQEFQWFLPGIQ